MNNFNGSAGAAEPPPGWIPNFDDPSDAGWNALLAVIIVSDVVATILFFMRLYVKATVSREFVIEDYTCTTAYVLIILFSATTAMMMRYGEGYHAWEVSQNDYMEVLRWLYISTLIYCPAAFFTKVTLLLLIARAFAANKRASRLVYIVIACLAILYIPIQIVKVVICLPIAAYWDPRVDSATCLNQRKVFIADICVALATDIFILIFPLPLTWNLRFELWKKVKIVALLGVGGCAAGLTAWRLYRVVLFLDSEDLTADFVLLDISTILEVALGFWCACLPSINLWLESRKGQKAYGSASRPRGSLDEQAQRRGGRAKSLISTFSDTTHLPSRKHSSFPPVETTQMNFDLELAMLTGNPPLRAGNHARPLLSRNKLKRMTSTDGRREGWLAPLEGEKGGLRRLLSVTLGCLDFSRSRSKKETAKSISKRAGGMDESPPCGPDEIWQGPRPNMPAMQYGKACINRPS